LNDALAENRSLTSNEGDQLSEADIHESDEDTAGTAHFYFCFQHKIDETNQINKLDHMDTDVPDVGSPHKDVRARATKVPLEIRSLLQPFHWINEIVDHVFSQRKCTWVTRLS
jgi:hypothetical protein